MVFFCNCHSDVQFKLVDLHFHVFTIVVNGTLVAFRMGCIAEGAPITAVQEK